MEDLKQIVAKNITELRTAQNLTQAELGEKLNYSDKSISKWERGEAIPDVRVLKEMGGIFGVTVDYLICSHDGEEPPAADSMEMLKLPDAAYIKGMGRCFIQIGNDELFEQVQTSYSGLDYKPDEPRAEEMPQLLTNTGHVVRAVRKSKVKKLAQDGKTPEVKEDPTQMTAVLKRIHEVAEEHGLSESRQMWLPEMPRHVYLDNLSMFRKAAWDGKRYPNPQGDVLILAGLADDVANQRYLPYVVNLTESRNLILTGLAGTGKTTLVQSMVYSLCSMYDPEHMHMYILSLTSQTLGSLSEFPQVGDIAFDGETVEIKRFVNMIYAEIQRRADQARTGAGAGHRGVRGSLRAAQGAVCQR